MNFSIHAFNELSAQQLYNIMQLRQKVFVVEQNCPYLDADGFDCFSWHLSGYHESGDLWAYTRVLPPDVVYPHYASIGRVVTDVAARRLGWGRQIMQHSIVFCQKTYPNIGIKIGAQAYLQTFYESFGFEVIGEAYLEDDIPHIPMLLR
ncbi:MAG: GNAT family N-acetyltransferase [Chitinophagales bacterium]|nr:GNAT family N-acetyltransferase [Chitinophagales bacterium]